VERGQLCIKKEILGESYKLIADLHDLRYNAFMPVDREYGFSMVNGEMEMGK